MNRRLQLAIKHTFDFCAALIGIIILSPVYIFAALAILICMPGPILFKQSRAGKGGKEFCIYKFRTMKVDRDAEKNFDTSKDENRLTLLGKILRRLKIDETPQLFNVLFMDMSMVGPRPTLMCQVEKYDDFQKQRLLMRPGMTGLAQINGNISLEWQERIVYDVEYVKNFSLWLDIKILLKTVLVVIFGEDRYKKIPVAHQNNEEGKKL